jgi:colicin import membrane protein
MRTGLTISTTAHALVLAWGLISFASPKPLEVTDAVPVDVITDEQFTQMTAGAREAPKAPAPRPVVDRVDPTPKPAPDPLPKVAEQEVRPTAQASSPPPEPTPPEPQRTPPPVPTRAPEPRPRVAEPPKPEPKPQPDPIAEALKREPEKPEPPKPEPPKPPTAQPAPRPVQQTQPAPARPTQPAPPDRTFNPNQIAALLDRRQPTRTAATGAQPNQTAALGTATGNAARLSQSEIDALRAQIQACWNPPIGTQDAQSLIVKVRIALNQDGSLAAEPVLTNRGNAPTFQIAAESAMRAVRRCAPYRMPIAKYDAWRDVEITFDPRDMLRG